MNDEKIFLESRCVEQSWTYYTTESKYVYLLHWRLDWGFTLRRRLKTDGWLTNLDFWNKRRGENYIQLDGGQFDPAYSARPIIRFEGGDTARAIIREDIRKHKLS